MSQLAAGNTSNSDCVFCAIVNGLIKSYVLFENDSCLAFLDIAPATKGHTLVIPKVHVEDLFEVGPELLGEIMSSMQEVANLLLRRLNPDGVTLFQANRKAGWQEVMHMHVHVVPRWENDKLRLPWKWVSAPQNELQQVAQMITLR